MQVKKFEARTMKEALDMVKSQLGPDAIILSARDNQKSFGLVGEGSVEITAAISEQTLNKKKFVESKMREEDRQKFVSSSARAQKEIIEKMVNEQVAKATPRPITTQRYVDIDYEEVGSSLEEAGNILAQERIRNAAKRAWSEFQSQDAGTLKGQNIGGGVLHKVSQILPKSLRGQGLRGVNTFVGDEVGSRIAGAAESANASDSKSQSEIAALKNEIENLRNLVSEFQKIPQNISLQTNQMAATNQMRHPGAEYGLSYDCSAIFSKLTDEGIHPDIVAGIISEFEKTNPPIKYRKSGYIEGWVAKYILEKTKVVADPSAGKFHCFLGPSGSGKTSTLVKFASHLVVRDKRRIALLTTDTFKVGAAEQLKIYAQILNVPFAIIRSGSDWSSIQQNSEHFDKIIVDFPGLSLKRPEDIHLLKGIMPSASFDANFHLVLSATSKDQDLLEYGKRFSLLHYRDVIFTGIDQSAHFGSIYNFNHLLGVGIHSFGLGPRIPEDFEYATRERVLDLIFKITKMQQQEKAGI